MTATRIGAFHPHDAELVGMDEATRGSDQAELDGVAVVDDRCPRCGVEVAVGVMTTERDLEPQIIQ